MTETMEQTGVTVSQEDRDTMLSLGREFLVAKRVESLLFESFAESLPADGRPCVPCHNVWFRRNGRAEELLFSGGWAEALPADDNCKTEYQWFRAAHQLTWDVEYELRNMMNARGLRRVVVDGTALVAHNEYSLEVEGENPNTLTLELGE